MRVNKSILFEPVNLAPGVVEHLRGMREYKPFYFITNSC